MLYEDLAEVASDLEWALLEIRAKFGKHTLALKRADAALERLNAIVAELAPDDAQMRSGSNH